MTTLNLNIHLPDDLAREAQRRGLLSSEGIEAMVRETLRQDRVDKLFEVMERTKNSRFPPLTQEQVQVEIEAARRERRERDANRG